MSSLLLSSSSSSTSSRTATVSEFVAFLFRSQLVVDAPTSTSSNSNTNDPNSPHRNNPELDGLSGMMLRTFSESSRREEESDWVYSRRSSLNRSRFDNARRVDGDMSGRTSSETQTGSGGGWRVYGHSRQSSASSTDST